MALSNRLAGNAVGVVCMVTWATTFPVSVAILKTWNPLLLTPVRMGVAGVVVALVAILAGQGRATRLLLLDLRFLLTGVLFGLSSISFVAGQKETDPVTAAVIISAMPLVSAMLGWFVGRERITAALLVALVLVVSGGIMTSAAPAGEGMASSPLGAAFMFIATLLYLWYTRLIVEDFAALPVLAKTAASTVAGALLAAGAAAASVLFGIVTPDYDLSAATAGLLAWLGLAVGFSAVLWFWVSGKIGVTVAAMHNNLVPFYVILMAAAVGSAVSGQQLLGALLVIAGTVIVQLPASLWRSRTEGA